MLWVLLAAAGLLGCRQQAYRVFAVQLTPATTAAASAPATMRAHSRIGVRAGARSQGPPAEQDRDASPAWDLNRVPAATLQLLPGITAATVQAMVDGRPYRAKRDLLKRRILTDAQYAQWKGDLVVHRTPPPPPGGQE